MDATGCKKCQTLLTFCQATDILSGEVGLRFLRSCLNLCPGKKLNDDTSFARFVRRILSMRDDARSQHTTYLDEYLRVGCFNVLPNSELFQLAPIRRTTRPGGFLSADIHR